MQTPRFIASIHDIMHDYDGFIVDLWGVVHDGTHAYPGIRDTFATLRSQHKHIVMLSNAPRRAATSTASLTYFGITPDVYDALITSGETTYHLLNQHHAKRRCYLICPDDEADFIDGLPLMRTTSPEDADIALAIGHYHAFQPLHELHDELHQLRAAQIPMICANPDIEVIKLDGTRYPCAGEIAAYYETIGGNVTYIGKPHSAVYQAALSQFPASLSTDRILAVGDNPATDILGAQRESLDSLLVTQGVLSGWERSDMPYEAYIMRAIENSAATPTYYCKSFT